MLCLTLLVDYNSFSSVSSVVPLNECQLRFDKLGLLIAVLLSVYAPVLITAFLTTSTGLFECDRFKLCKSLSTGRDCSLSDSGLFIVISYELKSGFAPDLCFYTLADSRLRLFN